MKSLSRILSLASILVAGLVLSGCHHESIWKVTHFNDKLEVVKTEEATNYFPNGGCISYVKTGDSAYSSICGNVLVEPLQKQTTSAAHPDAQIYRVRQLFADGETKEIFDATNAYVNDGCISFLSIYSPSYYSAVCGHATQNPVPKGK